MRSTYSILVALAATLTSSALAAGQLVDNNSPLRILAPREAKPILVAPPARSRHATRDHRAISRAKRDSNDNIIAAVPSGSKKSTLKKRQNGSGSRRCKAKKLKSTSSSSSSNDNDNYDDDDSSSTGTIHDSKTTTDDSDSTSGSVGDIDFDPGSSFLKIGNIYAGFLPDDGSGGGQAESMADINKVLPAKSAFYGRYAQVSNGKTFDGSQLYHVMDDIKASGAILQASVMPYKTWYGLTEDDNRNAIAVAKVCNDIYKTHGVEVWLRFAHEMNWYQTDGTYAGGVQDFQTGWKVLSKAIEEHAPETKMYWSPNVGSDSDYEKYYPKEGRVDIVGFDWYPNSASDSFVDRAKKFHDKYAVNGIKMFQGETGLHYTGSNDEKMQWVKSLSSKETQEAMPNYMGWAWFNYDKFENGRRVDFKIVKPGEGESNGINGAVRSYFAA